MLHATSLVDSLKRELKSRGIVTEAEVVKYLVRLNRISFLELLLNNRITRLVSRTFRRIPDCPIQKHFREQAEGDYLESQFEGENELMRLMNVMPSRQSITSLRDRMTDLARDFSQRHQEDAKPRYEEEFSISFLLATRP